MLSREQGGQESCRAAPTHYIKVCLCSWCQLHEGYTCLWCGLIQSGFPLQACASAKRGKTKSSRMYFGKWEQKLKAEDHLLSYISFCSVLDLWSNVPAWFERDRRCTVYSGTQLGSVVFTPVTWAHMWRQRWDDCVDSVCCGAIVVSGWGSGTWSRSHSCAAAESWSPTEPHKTQYYLQWIKASHLNVLWFQFNVMHKSLCLKESLFIMPISTQTIIYLRHIKSTHFHTNTCNNSAVTSRWMHVNTQVKQQPNVNQV